MFGMAGSMKHDFLPNLECILILFAILEVQYTVLVVAYIFKNMLL